LVAVAVAGVEMLQPIAGRALERAVLETEEVLRLVAGDDVVAIEIPVPDDIAGAGQSERPPFGLAEKPGAEIAAGKGVLDDREADQEDDQHEAGGERWL